MDSAPYVEEVTTGPAVSGAYWATASDGVRIRVGVWPEGHAGTIFFFPGRTEYVEKYALNARQMGARGYASLAVDWRGQGMAERLTEDPMVGHVDRFMDFQKDVAATYELAEALGLPRPWYLIGHSMGGAIGLRALNRAHTFQAAAFSAPMWGIRISPVLSLVAYPIAVALDGLGQSKKFAPSTNAVSYVASQTFEENQLTTDPDMWAYMQRQARHDPSMRLGGPSVRWLVESIRETRALHALPTPNVPVFTALGTQETIVDSTAVQRMVRGWDDPDFALIDGAKHEIMMETDEIRSAFFDRCEAAFNRGRS